MNREEHVKPFLQSMRENYAFMQDIDMEQVMILDCRNIGDPASTSMRDHIGWNPYNLKHMCSTKAWKKFWREMALDLDEGLRKAFDEGKEVVIITVCKSGRHRSTANAELMGHVFKEVYGAETSVEHLCDGPNWRYTCGGRCEQCSWQVGKEEGEQAYSDSVALWKKYMPQVWRPKGPTPEGETASDAAASSSAAAAVVTPQVVEATTSSKASAPSPIAEAKAAPKDAAPSAPSTLGDIVTSGAGTDAEQAPSQLDQSGNVMHDLTHILDDVDDGDDLKKLTFLFLHRVYSVFCPDKTAKTTELIVKYEDKLRELICSVGGKYLAYGQAEELLASLVNALKAGKRTELNWNVRLEDANRSLDEAIRMMEEAPTDTTRNDAGTSSTDHPRDRTRSRDHVGGASRAPSKGSSKGRSQNTAVESDPASLDHQEVRHDLLALGEDPNHPHVLS